MIFDERHLRAFIAIAETGSLGRAARIVNLTQPSLSRLVQNMEVRLGHRLFERDGRGMSLTPAGDLMLPRARHLVSETQTMRDELDALRGLRRGTVRIGAVAAVLRTLVARALGELLVECSGLVAEAREAVDSELLDALLNRQIDLCVTASQLDHPDVALVGRCDQVDSFAVFCATAHPIASQPGLAAVMAENWVMPGKGFTPRLIFDDLLRRLGSPPARVAVETASVEAMIAVSAASRLLCWLPVPLLASHVASGAMRRLEVPELARSREFRLYRRRSGLLPDAAQQFLRYLPLA